MQINDMNYKGDCTYKIYHRFKKHKNIVNNVYIHKT